MNKLATALAACAFASAAWAADVPLAVSAGIARCKTVSAFGLDFDKLSGKVEVHGSKWRFTDITGGLLGGKAFARAEFDAAKRPFEVSAVISITGAQLAPFAREHGIDDISGNVEGMADISWSGRTKRVSGVLSLSITGGNLGDIPFGVKVFRFLGSPDIFGKKLTDAEISLIFDDKGVEVQSFRVASPNNDVVLVVEPGGSMRWDGKLDLRVHPVIRSKLLSKIPVAGHIAQAVIGFLQRRSMRVHVKGTIEKPQMSWAPAG